MSSDGGGVGGACYCGGVSAGGGGGICVGVFPCVSHHAGPADQQTYDLIWADLCPVCPLHHNWSVLGIGMYQNSGIKKWGAAFYARSCAIID